MRNFRIGMGLVCAVFAFTWATRAQTEGEAPGSVDTLRQELNDLKSEYEARIRALEKRLRDVETPAPAARPSPAPDQDLVRLQSQLDRASLDFSFSGYLRSGFGSDGKGGSQSAFRAPNAGAAYRLGNEAETYLETTFAVAAPQDQIENDEVAFDTRITLAYFTPTSNNNAFDATTSLREAYASASGILPGNPSTTFWAGERFYSRYDVHMNDFYYRDLSGYGGGIEHVSLLENRLQFAAAWLGGSIDDLDSSGSPYSLEDGQFKKDNLDLSFYGIDLPGGEMALHATYAAFDGDSLTRENDEGIEFTDSDGGAVSVIFDSELGDGVQNRFAAQYGSGAAYNFKTQMILPAGVELDEATEFNFDDVVQWRVLNHLVIDRGESVSLMALALYDELDLGTDDLGSIEWISLGLRPAYHFNRYFSIALEAGYDHTRETDGDDGALYKLTLAPQITPDASPLSRPSIRTFVTYAWWDDDFVGKIAPQSYGNDSEGLALGVQLETWW